MANTEIDFVAINTKELPNGHTVRRGQVMAYISGVRIYHAVVMSWSKSGNTLTLHKASVRWDEDGRIDRLNLHNGRHSVFDARYKPETGDYETNKFHGYTLGFVAKTAPAIACPGDHIERLKVVFADAVSRGDEDTMFTIAQIIADLQEVGSFRCAEYVIGKLCADLQKVGS